MTVPVPVDDRQREMDSLRDRIRVLEGFALDHGHERCARVIEAARALVAVTRGGILELNYLWTDLRDALDEVPEEDPR